MEKMVQMGCPIHTCIQRLLAMESSEKEERAGMSLLSGLRFALSAA